MEIAFAKYHGTGNDFVLIDNRDKRFPTENLTVIREICQRRFGIGSDGLILIEPDDQSDFYMNFFNPDASQSFCGNGSRCAVHFAKTLGLFEDECLFRAIDGDHRAHIEDDQVKISIRPTAYPVQSKDDGYVVNTGSPHFIRFCSDLQNMDFVAQAREIRNSALFREEGINVNFVQVLDEMNIRMRTFERGVEDETLSCGTGVTAAALTHLMRFGSGRKVNVETRGGELQVLATKGAENLFLDIWLCGPAVKTFSGTYNCASC